MMYDHKTPHLTQQLIELVRTRNGSFRQLERLELLDHYEQVKGQINRLLIWRYLPALYSPKEAQWINKLTRAMHL